MDKLIEILEDVKPDIDYNSCTTLISDGLLDSFAILSLVAELEEEFDIEILPGELTVENFNSATAIWNMVKRLQEEG